jgi:hypothetical protein
MPDDTPSPEVHVLVVFYSRYGITEKLALAAGVGALQTRANIRLRRLADSAPPETIRADAEWSKNLARMQMDYVVPRDADPEWADVIIFASPADAPAEIRDYVGSLATRGLAGDKIAAPFTSGNNRAALASIYAAAACSGFTVVPLKDAAHVDSARAYGRAVATMARALKKL